MYTLYYNPGSASFAVHWMLIELQLEHNLVALNFDSKEQKSADYLKLNPGGMVPTLIVEGKPRTECAALLILLAERHPHAQLAPAIGSTLRPDYLQWMFFAANTLQPAFRAWFYPHEPAGESNRDASQVQARQKIELAWDRINTQLATSGGFVVGDRLTTVDFLITMLMRWSRNMPKPATEWPHIRTYLAAMRARPSLQQVHRVEGLTDWISN